MRARTATIPRLLLLLGGAVALAGLASRAAADGGPDEQRSAWRFRRAVTLPAGAMPTPLVTVDVPPEVQANARPDLGDLRLVGADGTETPYVLERAEERALERRWNGALADVRIEKHERSVWTVGLGEARTFDSVALDVADVDFAKRVRVEVSDDGQAWRMAREDAGVFDRPWSGRLRYTTVTFPAAVTARFVRVTADDRRSRPVTVRGLTAAATRQAAGLEWRRPVALTRLPGGPPSRYRVELPPVSGLDALELSAADPAFARRARLRQVREVNGRRDEALLGEGDLFRLKLEDEALAVDCLTLWLQQRPSGGELVLEIDDRDSPPLRGLQATAVGAATRLVFPSEAGPLLLYYGNETTRAPQYDIEALAARLAFHPPLSAALLAPEAENPRFRKAPPLPFAAARAAGADVTRWKAIRRFSVAAGEDLYTITLAAEDLPLLRPDLGDLRVVDEQDRQVPCVAEAGFASRKVALAVEPQPPSPREKGSRRVALRPGPGFGAQPRPLPFSALELQFTEPYFTRPARVKARAPESGRGERTVFAGSLSRAAGAEGPLTLALDGAPAAELTLEIDEGDNAPLTLTAAQGVVAVPRVAFKAGPGAYRLLLGNPEADPPRYDIGALRQQVLAYSALKLEAAPAEPNPAFRRRAGDYLRNAPPTLVLWGVLAAAVVVLLLLTARIVKTPPA